MIVSFHRRSRLVGLALLASLAAGAASFGDAAPASALGATTDCEQVIALVVRGSGEPAGSPGPTSRTYGYGGLGMLSGVTTEMQQKSIWRVRKVGLDYPALLDLRYANSLSHGKTDLRTELNDLASRCPGSRTVLLGYSQGAHVIGDVLATAYATGGLSAAARSRIGAVVFFGDPAFRYGESFNRGTANSGGIFARGDGELDWIGSRLWSYCDRGDLVCSPPDSGTSVHQSYGSRWHVEQAFAFIEGRLWTSGSPSGGGAGSSPIPGPSSSEGVTLQEIAQAGGYTGPVDGVPGVNTWRGVQQVMRGYGYTGPVDGAPGTNTYAAMQRLAQKGGYTGPVDGALGVNSWKGLQTVLRGFGYAGPIDGVPGTNTYAALQRLAKLGGYTGPIDGALGVNSWKGVQKVMSGYGYAGPVDGVPGTNTYSALQRMAQLGGYTGPVDGLPGPNTWAALARLI